MAKRAGAVAALEERMGTVLSAATEEVRDDYEQTERIRAGRETGNVTFLLGELHPDPENPRKSFPREEMEDLKASIRALGGLETPIKIYWHPVYGRWTIKHGERRWRVLRELVQEGHTEFEQVPVLVDRNPDRTPEGRQRVRIAQVVENNVRANLLPLETAEQYYLIATEGREEPMSSAQLARLTGTRGERTVQRHVYIVGGLSLEERDLIREGYPEAPLVVLEALVRWFEKEAPDLSPESRLVAVERFVRERPREKMVRVVLRDLVPRKPAGRRARKRFSAGLTPGGSFQVKMMIPREMAMDREALRRAREDLMRAIESLREMEANLGEHEGEGGGVEG